VTEAELRRALRLVVILDHAAAGGRDLADLGAGLARAGATMLQLRAKGLPPGDLAQVARRLRAAAPATPLIVNDRLDVALATGCAGCHLGQDDLPLAAARRLVPAGFVLGASAGDAGEARRAREEGCDYLGIGPVHTTANKQDAGAAIGAEGFGAVRRIAPDLPCVAIGGVTAADVPELIEAGADGVAVIGAVLSAPDPEAATRALRAALDACFRS
jgi:thiamine-phosphate pyrophosphorylase